MNDREALIAWRALQGKEKPVLVVVAASGGGIVASYWTAACLERIERENPEFPKRLRVITGASGGMLGAAVYVARQPPAFGQRTAAQTAQDVAEDSLTPVVRRMMLGDLPRSFYGGKHRLDRGRTLEDAWKTNTGGATGARMSNLAEGEKLGSRPSLVLSPMVIESGRFLLISNLDVEGLGNGIQFFPRFPAARDAFELGTAVRIECILSVCQPECQPADRPAVPRRRCRLPGQLWDCPRSRMDRPALVLDAGEYAGAPAD